jgi:type I restriction enzyme M protein
LPPKEESMLDTETRNRIDDCRDILVGKLPDPKSQIEQITIGLVYKFMDDMDKESIELGGMAKFFSDEYEKYSWENLFDAKVTATEMLKLYSDAIESMENNPNIPQLFRDIFKNAYLPYRDPETLRMFLKTIGEFEYTHSEKLGDAFEYLLSVMGSQGDAGQFRTPRHIIDFIVEAVDPKKTDTILDPACGTAGFLISAFKRIKEKSNNQLTPDERKKLIRNFIGYDISPDMVRLSLVNLYLHGFSDPNIIEYDTLTTEERWNDNFDVILANPPFMSPKGGIRPHKKFKVTSNRSEVLFVDYIAEHLNPNGKAGIIVPEGVIFQRGKAYQELRKMLVENFLYSVVSLPAGIFNPYSGIKTSVLLMDKAIAKRTNRILFLKIDNDGYNLGAQRNVIKGGQLYEAFEILTNFKNSIENRTDFENISIAHAVEKTLIAKNGEFNLSGKRYKSLSEIDSNYPLVTLGDLCDLKNGYAFRSKDYVEYSNTMNVRMSNIRPNAGFDINYNPRYLPDSFATKYSEYLLNDGDVIIAMTDLANDPKILGAPTIVKSSNKSFLLNQRVGKFFNIDQTKLYIPFLRIVLNTNVVKEYYKSLGGGGLQINIGKKDILNIQIPLPSINIQKEIVAGIEGYQKEIEDFKKGIEEKELQIEDRIAKVWNK